MKEPMSTERIRTNGLPPRDATRKRTGPPPSPDPDRLARAEAKRDRRAERRIHFDYRPRQIGKA